jgi:3-oxoacyl-[acyl-carrier protein] reductase
VNVDLTGKVALVTGGSRGIGAAVAELLASCGADVAIGYRSRTKDAEDVVSVLRESGVRAMSHAAELSDRSAVDAMFARVVSELGRLDIFVANAGIWPVEEVGVGDMADERWRRTMIENVDGMFFTARAAARTIADHGRMVFVSSTAGQRGEAYHADYGASKGAMIAFVKSLAVELAPRDVTVNSVAPGWVDTDMCAEPYANGGKERIAAGIPLGRVATPMDIAAPIVFLCSPWARHITGEIMNVNGGSVLCG